MNTDRFSTDRILLIDEDPAVHEEFRKMLRLEVSAAQPHDIASAALPGRWAPRAALPRFEIDGALQAGEGLDKVQEALREGRPYSMAYVGVRIPNGWDGIETISRLWQAHGNLLIVLCTAFSDHPREDLREQLGYNSRLLMLRKPFEPLEVRQLTQALGERARAEKKLQYAWTTISASRCEGLKLKLRLNAGGCLSGIVHGQGNQTSTDCRAVEFYRRSRAVRV
jgi:two-component system NtrC family sensor kinase